MNLSNDILVRIIALSDNIEITNCFIRKFINTGDLINLSSRLQECYSSLKQAKDKEVKDIFARTRLYIEGRIESENLRSVAIDLELDDYLPYLPKPTVKEYEKLLEDFKRMFE